MSLTHLDSKGEARMVDVGAKDITERTAVATGAVVMRPETLRLIREGGFIPALDDMAPRECPFSHYRHMIEKLQSIRLG